VQLEARLARQLRIEAPVEVVQSQPFVQAGLREAALREPGSAPVQLVLQDRGERLDERLLVALSLQDPGVQRGPDAGQPQRAQRAFNLGWAAIEFPSVCSLDVA
jgi:hypothetical protein